MASWDHEGIVELFRSDPRLAAELLRGPLGIELPAFAEARIESGALTQLNPAELRADLVVSLSDGARPVLAIIIEAQREEDAESSSRGRRTSLRCGIACSRRSACSS